MHLIIGYLQFRIQHQEIAPANLSFRLDMLSRLGPFVPDQCCKGAFNMHEVEKPVTGGERVRMGFFSALRALSAGNFDT